MDIRKILSVALVLVVASFFLGRFTNTKSTFLAASENTSIVNIDQGQQDTLRWDMQVNPLNYATYTVSYPETDSINSPVVTKQVRFFAGSYLISKSLNYYSTVDGTYFGANLDGNNFYDGVAVIGTSEGGTGHFPKLVVLKKNDDQYVEIARTDQPQTFFSDRIQVRSIIVQKGIITVSILGKGPKDGGCCPTVPMEMKFRVIDGHIKT